MKKLYDISAALQHNHIRTIIIINYGISACYTTSPY